MKKFAIFVIITFAILYGVILWLIFKPQEIKQQRTEQSPATAPISKMKISSPAFGNNEKIPAKFTCDGENLNPPLTISEVPENAKSLVLIADDPDAPGRTFVHWTVWNIPPDTREIAEGAKPAGASEGLTDFGKTGYGGPCPPSGTHRYFFKLYALDTTLQLSQSSQKADIEAAMQGHILAQTELVGLYSRQN